MVRRKYLCLLSNAVKYSNSGVVSIKVSLVTEDMLPKEKLLDDQQYLCFEIEDNGCGLSPEASEHLFQSFKQTQRSTGGVGLGLYTLAKRIEALKGFYGVKGRNDGEQGSLFWFAIPYIFDEAICKSSLDLILSNSISKSKSNDLFIENRNIELNNSNKIESNIEIESLNSKLNLDSIENNEKLNILVVDDSIAILKMSSLMLKRHGHNVEQAVNGLEAVEKVKLRLQNDKTSYDVILIDIQMPVMDGFDFLAKYQNLPDEKRRKTKIVMVSSSLDINDLRRAKENPNVLDLLSKPLNMNELLNVLEQNNSDSNLNS